MKKYITLLLLVLLMPTLVLAEPAYTSKTLEEALKEEKIEYDLGEYTESEDKVNVYLFRGQGCSHCYEFLEYVANTLIKEKGDKINVVTYEVWNDKNNAELMEKVAKHFDEEAGGVPFIIIGDKTFSGYAESMNKELNDAIDKLYDSEEKYDVFEKMGVDPNEEKKETKTDNSSVVAFTIVALVAVIVLVVTGFRKK